MSKAAPELTHTTIATWTLAIQRALLASGIDAEPLIREAGIDPQSIRDPERRITVGSMWKLWRLCVERTGNDAFGLQVAANLYPTHFYAMTFALQASATLREALQRIGRYARVVTTVADIKVIEGAQVVSLILGSTGSTSPQQPYFPSDAFMGGVFRALQDLLGGCAAEGLLEVHLRRPQPQRRDEFEQFFGVPLHFGADDNALVIATDTLDRDLPAANSTIAGMSDQLLGDYLGRMRNEQVSLQVRRKIIALLSTDQLGLEQVAEHLHMSGRSLHRKLAKEGTSFKSLQDEIRHDLALRYLSMPGKSLNDIAFSLGFIDQSSFNRAFKRWTGRNPGQHRRELKERC